MVGVDSTQRRIRPVLRYRLASSTAPRQSALVCTLPLQQEEAPPKTQLSLQPCIQS